jgi:hypothetical protein
MCLSTFHKLRQTGHVSHHCQHPQYRQLLGQVSHHIPIITTMMDNCMAQKITIIYIVFNQHVIPKSNVSSHRSVRAAVAAYSVC